MILYELLSLLVSSLKLFTFCYSIVIVVLTLTLMMKLHKHIWVKFLLVFLTMQVAVFGLKILNTGMILLEVAANCFVATMNHNVSSHT